MNIYKIHLTEEPDLNHFQPYMKAYILDRNEDGPKPCVVICPGGAYTFLAENWEGERTAMAYAAAGFHAVVVHYTTSPGGVFPCQLRQVARAIELCRQKSEEWQIHPHQISVCGFSAGGHLAASVSTLWNETTIFSQKNVEKKLHRPDAAVLCYPVISSGEKAHYPSIQALTGCKEKKDNERLWEFVSLENRVNEGTVPTFLWHTVDDAAVPVENSMVYVAALRKKNIPFELHLYPAGGHGLQLATQKILRNRSVFNRNYNWFSMSIDWLADRFKL